MRCKGRENYLIMQEKWIKNNKSISNEAYIDALCAEKKIVKIIKIVKMFFLFLEFLLFYYTRSVRVNKLKVCLFQQK